MSRINVKTEQKRFDTAPDLYGIFFEDISRAGDGGLYPEMLRNRSFEDSLIPEGCTSSDSGKTFVSPTGWIDEFNNGEGMTDWITKGKIKATPIPAWYCDNAEMKLDDTDTLNANRKVSLKVSFRKNGSLRNIGYAGVAQEEGRSYHFYMFAKASSRVTLDLSVRRAESAEGINSTEVSLYEKQVISGASIEINNSEWTRYDAVLTASATTGTAEFVITAPEGGDVAFGFMSLMPSDTFMNHGLRKDLVRKLQEMKPAFLRFPGGCIVEGFTMETALFFRKTVGPVWERPSHWLLWHYRTTNGLGFHEYLQLCEDLNLQALYVCNCGMTCQGRGAYYFNDKEMEDIIQDTLDALEYAMGSADSKWGGLRAQMGHPAPFSIKYLEIGNENSGPEYESRYEQIRKAVLSKYPDLLIISNDRSERTKCDIVDDHYYNMPEFYAEKVGIYDDYDRTKPDVFVGEFAVNQTYEGQLRAAVAEAMFMVGFERNQDKVKLCSYAPLFEHVHFYSWYPNLLIYDNYRSYGIPSYYVFKLFGKNRGEKVVASNEETGKIYRELHGLPMITGDFGVKYRNARLNGSDAEPYKNIFGKAIDTDGCKEVIVDEDNEMSRRKPPFKVFAAVALGTEADVEKKEYEFEAELYMEKGQDIGMGMLCAPKPFSFYDRMNPNPRDPWMLFNLEPLRWMFRDGQATLMRGAFRLEPVAEPVNVNVRYGEFNKVHYILRDTEVDLYLNDELIQTVELPNYPSMCSVSTDSEEEVIIKIVNFSEKEDDVQISLDCDLESEYRVEYLTGKADAENTLDDPEHVCDKQEIRTGADREFVFYAAPLSVNVLILKKKAH
jgi:alpha-N-arabinofuranosidase